MQKKFFHGHCYISCRDKLISLQRKRFISPIDSICPSWRVKDPRKLFFQYTFNLVLLIFIGNRGKSSLDIFPGKSKIHISLLLLFDIGLMCMNMNRESCLFPLLHNIFCLFGFLTSSSTTRLYRGWAPRQERLTILRAATHETELGDHDFCLSRSHYTDTDPTCRERAATAGIEPGTSSPGVARSTAELQRLPTQYNIKYKHNALVCL